MFLLYIHNVIQINLIWSTSDKVLSSDIQMFSDKCTLGVGA